MLSPSTQTYQQTPGLCKHILGMTSHPQDPSLPSESPQPPSSLSWWVWHFSNSCQLGVGKCYTLGVILEKLETKESPVITSRRACFAACVGLGGAVLVIHVALTTCWMYTYDYGAEPLTVLPASGITVWGYLQTDSVSVLG
jgi:hypothetical protein